MWHRFEDFKISSMYVREGVVLIANIKETWTIWLSTFTDEPLPLLLILIFSRVWEDVLQLLFPIIVVVGLFKTVKQNHDFVRSEHSSHAKCNMFQQIKNSFSKIKVSSQNRLWTVKNINFVQSKDSTTNFTSKMSLILRRKTKLFASAIVQFRSPKYNVHLRHVPMKCLSQTVIHSPCLHRSYCTPPRTDPLGSALLDLVVYEAVCSDTLEGLCEYFDDLIESTPHLKSADVNYSVRKPKHNKKLISFTGWIWIPFN